MKSPKWFLHYMQIMKAHNIFFIAIISILLISAYIAIIGFFMLSRDMIIDKFITVLHLEIERSAFVYSCCAILLLCAIFEIFMQAKTQGQNDEINFYKTIGLTSLDTNVIILVPYLPPIILFSSINAVLLFGFVSNYTLAALSIMSIAILVSCSLSVEHLINSASDSRSGYTNKTLHIPPRRLINNRWIASVHYELFTPPYYITALINVIVLSVTFLIRVPSLITYHIVSWLAIWPMVSFLQEENTDHLLSYMLKITRIDLILMHMRSSLLFVIPFYTALFIYDVLTSAFIASLARFILFSSLGFTMVIGIILIYCVNQPNIKSKLIALKFLFAICINILPFACLPLSMIYSIVNRDKMSSFVLMED